MAYDAMGRNYQNKIYAVSSSGTTSTPQTSNLYYNPAGVTARNAHRVVSSLPRTNTMQWVAYSKPIKPTQTLAITRVSDPSSVANAVVMEQQELAWDDAGNLLSTTSRVRFDDATGNGELQNPTTSPKARVSYFASYVDGIGRTIASANYGTNGGPGAGSWARPATIPTRSDTVLVTTTAYSTAGNVSGVTDPAAITNSHTYDNSDRLITAVENQGGTAPAVRTTHYTYTPDGWLSTLTSDNPDTGNQTTTWVRNVTTAQGSALNSKRLVYQKILPGGDTTTYLYNRQLQVTRMTDPNGSVHDYAYDKVGRLLSDTASTIASGIDTTVGKLETAYNERGLMIRNTSKNAAGSSVLNEVKSAYNDFNQKITEWQEHGGAVNTSTSLKVQYSYASGSANTVRPTGITYPNGTAITTAYGGTIADAISRPDAVKESTTTLASFAYLGLGTLVDQKVRCRHQRRLDGAERRHRRRGRQIHRPGPLRPPGRNDLEKRLYGTGALHLWTEPHRRCSVATRRESPCHRQHSGRVLHVRRPAAGCQLRARQPDAHVRTAIHRHHQFPTIAGSRLR